MIDLDWLFTNHNKKVVHVSTEIYPRQADDLIRVGPKADGGYVLTRRMFDQVDFLISCGLGYEFSFEIDFAKAKLGLKCQQGQACVIHAYDHTVFERSEQEYYYRKARSLKRYLRGKYARWHEMVAVWDTFFTGSPAKHIKRRVVSEQQSDNDASLEHIFRAAANECRPEAKLLLKIDIEGDEYAILEKLCADFDLARITGIICEFHDINKRRDEFRKVLGSLKEHFWLIHTHMNNDARTGEVLELAFENKNLASQANSKQSKVDYPRPGLDYACHTNRPDFVIDFQDPVFFETHGGVFTKLRDENEIGNKAIG